jgi:hypothetical protein
VPRSPPGAGWPKARPSAIMDAARFDADQARRLHRLGRRPRHTRPSYRAGPGPAYLAQPPGRDTNPVKVGSEKMTSDQVNDSPPGTLAMNVSIP